MIGARAARGLRAIPSSTHTKTGAPHARSLTSYHKLTLCGNVTQAPSLDEIEPADDDERARRKIRATFAVACDNQPPLGAASLLPADDSQREPVAWRVQAHGALARVAMRLKLSDNVIIEGRLTRYGSERPFDEPFLVTAVAVRPQAPPRRPRKGVNIGEAVEDDSYVP